MNISDILKGNYTANTATTTEKKATSQNTTQGTGTSNTKPTDKNAALISKAFEDLKGKISKDFKDQGSPAYRNALKTTKQAYANYDSAAFQKDVLTEIKERRQKSGRKVDAPISENEIKSAIRTTMAEVHQSFKNSLVSEMRRGAGLSGSFNGKGSLANFLA